VFAVDGQLLVGPAVVSPGEVVTYRLTYQLPLTRFENLTLNDFLPLPIFDVLNADGSGNSLVWTNQQFSGVAGDLPLAGQVGYGPAATDFISLYFGEGGLEPTLSTPGANLGGNSFSLEFGSFDVTPQATTIDVLFSIVMLDVAFADGLFLTNQVQGVEGTTNTAGTVSNDIAQIEVVGPELHVTKGVVATLRPDGTFEPTDPGGVIWNPPGPADSFSGSLTSGVLATIPNPVDTDLTGLDAGDRARFAIVVENQGARTAFDTIFSDSIPDGFVVPADGLNFQIRRGDGTLLTEGVHYQVTALPNPGDPTAVSFTVTMIDGSLGGVIPMRGPRSKAGKIFLLSPMTWNSPLTSWHPRPTRMMWRSPNIAASPALERTLPPRALERSPTTLRSVRLTQVSPRVSLPVAIPTPWGTIWRLARLPPMRSPSRFPKGSRAVSP
jgi:uncharacterized repeat protein (TIGR01451 family)